MSVCVLRGVATTAAAWNNAPSAQHQQRDVASSSWLSKCTVCILDQPVWSPVLVSRRHSCAGFNGPNKRASASHHRFIMQFDALAAARPPPKRQRGSWSSPRTHRPPPSAASLHSVQLYAAAEMLSRSRAVVVRLHNSSRDAAAAPCQLPRAFRCNAACADALRCCERLRLLGCGLLGMLVLRMSHASIPQSLKRFFRSVSDASRRLKLLDGILRRVGAGRAFCCREQVRLVQMDVRALLREWRFADAIAK